MTGRLLILAFMGFAAGCGQSAPSTIVKRDTAPSTKVDTTAQAAAALSAMEIVTQLKAGTATAEMLTVDFKKVIGEPLTPNEREKGFSDSSATEWLKVVGPRLHSTKVVTIGNSIGIYELEAGTLRLVNVDSKWRVDWFHAGRPKGCAPLLNDDAVKRFAVATFLDPLFTHNWELSEAALSLDAKKALAPPFDSDRLGYNRGTLNGKLKKLLNAATGYSVIVTDDKAIVTLTGAVEKKLALTLVPGPRAGVWLVGGID